jgi:hypothetical protein
MKVSQSDFAVGASGSGLIRTKRGEDGWTEGVVPTRHGFVSVYAQGDAQYSHHTRLDFIWAGRWYQRNFCGKRYSHRGLVTVAVRFAKEIAEAKP